MPTALTNATVVKGAFRLLYDILTANVTDTQSTPRSASAFIYGAFPDGDVTSKSSYPLVTIDTPQLEDEMITLGYGYSENELDIVVTVYGTKAEDAATIAERIRYTIANNLSTLRTYGLRASKKYISSADTGDQTRSGIKVHFVSYTFTFMYDYVR